MNENLRANMRSSVRVVLMVSALAVAGAAVAAKKPTAAAAQAPLAASAPLPVGAIARVNGATIPAADLDAAVRASRQPDTPALRATLKNQLIARELFRQASQKQHYDARADVQAIVEQTKTTAMMQAYLKDVVKPAPVTDDEVKSKYDAIVGSLGENEYKPSAIAVKDEATAKTILEQLKKGGDFAALAKQYSQGPNAAQGGALNWVSFKTPITAGNTRNWPQPLAESLVKLPKGAVSREPVQVGDAYWILRADDMRKTQIPTLDQSKDGLRKELEQVALAKATAQVVTELVKDARIQQ